MVVGGGGACIEFKLFWPNLKEVTVELNTVESYFSTVIKFTPVSGT